MAAACCPSGRYCRFMQKPFFRSTFKQMVETIGIVEGVSAEDEKLRQARALFVFLCAAHDLGKATPAFQTKDAKPSYAGLNDQRERDERASKCRDLDELILNKLKSAGFVCPESIPERFVTPHALCSQVILLREAKQSACNVAAILGAVALAVLSPAARIRNMAITETINEL